MNQPTKLPSLSLSINTQTLVLPPPPPPSLSNYIQTNTNMLYKNPLHSSLVLPHGSDRRSRLTDRLPVVRWLGQPARHPPFLSDCTC
ncbi:hypothetical protein HanPI659440_Chr10g0371401 [Helianthus annuus]|nr:hypothetical protein HanPI659440_Chr10g0371401 [Helianthus annuus]